VICTVCNAPGGETGHEHTSAALCGPCSLIWSEMLTERTEGCDWSDDGDGGFDLDRRAHDALMAEMRAGTESAIEAWLDARLAVAS
jgi:hypothetical protein